MQYPALSGTMRGLSASGGSQGEEVNKENIYKQKPHRKNSERL
jgi:hypothetical protein